MGSRITNLKLALMSLKANIEEYLDANSWEDHYSIYLAGEPMLDGKKFVSDVKDVGKELELPIIVFEDGAIFSQVDEIGTSDGYDHIELYAYVYAQNRDVLDVLSTLVRNKLNGLIFDIYNYFEGTDEIIGTGEIEDVVYHNVSNYDSTYEAEKHASILSTTLIVNNVDLI